MHDLKYKIIITLSFFTLLNSCGIKPEHDSSKWINTAKSNDYRTYLKFIIQQPTTTHFNQALKKYFKFRKQHWDSLTPLPSHCSSNCTNILVNEENNIFFENKLVDIDYLRKLSFDFFTKINRNDIEKKERRTSKGIFEITFTKSSTDLQKVVIEITEGINDYKNVLSQNWFHLDFKSLDQDKKNYLNSIFSHKIIFWKYEELPPPPLPPPPPPKNINNEKEKLN